jgi:uncharacterized protein (DUF433 family)
MADELCERTVWTLAVWDLVACSWAKLWLGLPGHPRAHLDSVTPAGGADKLRHPAAIIMSRGALLAIALQRKVVICAEVGLITGMKTSLVVKIDPEIMGGTLCFADTRVPVRTLIDYLASGDSLGDFLEDFPTVSHAQAVALLEEASELLMAHV